MSDLVRVRRALISVSDKTGVEAFAKTLAAMGVEIVSTGGTAKLLAAAGVEVMGIESLTGFPEMMDGRVKTLHPKVHGGLLGVRDNAEHAAAMKKHGIEPIDLLCVNLYPFQATIANPDVTREEAIEQIDIGGPAMVRSGSKNHAWVAVVTSPAQYGPVLAEMDANDGGTSVELREQLAAAAFAHTAAYDAAIAAYLRGGAQSPIHVSTPLRTTTAAPRIHGAAASKSSAPTDAATDLFPERLRIDLALHAKLRYGENPHQHAAVYRDERATGPSVVTAKQLHGKELSYNNLNDGAAALELARALASVAGKGRVAACVIKHANPCGAAVAVSGREAVEKAIAGDPLAAFGGIIAVSGTVDAGAAERLCGTDVFLEVLIAEDYTPDALEALKARWTNLRLLSTGSMQGEQASVTEFRSIRGGVLMQERDTLAPDPTSWEHKAGPKPSVEQLRAAAALEVIVRAMSSNAIAIGGEDGGAVRLFGGGVGQVDRVTACKIAAEKAGGLAKGAIAVSDAFFPFADGPTILIDAGVEMIVHAGGSKRDQETFDLCNQRGVTCMVTGVRRFRH